MIRLVKAAPAALLVLGLACTPSLAAPIPVIGPLQGASFHPAAAEKASSKVETTKAWLKTKKTQTTRWMGRQKQKLKRLANSAHGSLIQVRCCL
jgi:hypothetical protein